MNPEAVEYLNKVLAKNPSELTTDEILFLRARRTYLKPSQIEEYKEVLEVKTEKPNPTPTGTVKTKDGSTR